jgi:hypothetical protein
MARQRQGRVRDEWKETWDWAKQVWGNNDDYSFERFFRGIAQRRAEAEGWEELGSSDVWHASYDTVKTIKEQGNVKTREGLEKMVRDYSGYGY